jgi:hypothetical protein
MSITELKRIEDELDALIEMKAQCEDEAEDDYVDERLSELLHRMTEMLNLLNLAIHTLNVMPNQRIQGIALRTMDSYAVIAYLEKERERIRQTYDDP